MRVSRRAAMIGAGLGAAAMAAPAFAKPARATALAIYDSRLPEADLFESKCALEAVPLIDLAREDILSLRRIGLRAGDRVIGMTGWSQFVLLRGMLQEKGLRVRKEDRADRRRRSVFEWAMA